MTRVEFLLDAAQETKGDGDHWFRYLHKVIDEKGVRLSENDVEILLHSHLLSGFQKVTLKDAVTEGTYTHEYISSRSKIGWKPLWAPDWKALLGHRR